MESPKYVDKIKLDKRATIEMSSPFRNADIAFNWLNRDYPIYHEHSHWELFVIMSGEICHNINGKEELLKKGDVCLIRPVDKHSLKLKRKQKDNYQHINFMFSDEFARKILGVYDCYEEVLNEKESIHFALDASDISMIYDKTLLAQNLSQQKYEMSTKAIVSRILVKFFEQRTLFDSEYPEWLNEFMIYINNPDVFGNQQEIWRNTLHILIPGLLHCLSNM